MQPYKMRWHSLLSLSPLQPPFIRRYVSSLPVIACYMPSPPVQQALVTTIARMYSACHTTWHITHGTWLRLAAACVLSVYRC